MGGSTEGASGRVRMAASGQFGIPSRGSLPPRELRRWPHWQGSHGGMGRARRTPDKDRGPAEELHRRHQWQSSHGDLGPVRHAPPED
eukprot:7041108-Pyramimonas_sp.AAC.1